MRIILLIFLVSIAFSEPLYAKATLGPTDVRDENIQPTPREAWQWLEKEMSSEIKEIKALVEQDISKELLKKGPPEPNWNVDNLDVRAHLETLPGGAVGNALYDNSEDLPALTFYGGMPDRLLSEWTIVKGKPVSQSGAGEFGIMAVSSAHILVVSTPPVAERIGTTDCFQIDRIENYIRIYRDNRVPLDLGNDESAEQEAMAIIFSNMIAGGIAPFKGKYCGISKFDATGRIATFVYTANGQPFVNINDQDSAAEIVSDFDLRKMLTSKFDMSIFEEDDDVDSTAGS